MKCKAKNYICMKKNPVDPRHLNVILWGLKALSAAYSSSNTVRFFTRNVAKVKNLMIKTHWKFCVSVYCTVTRKFPVNSNGRMERLMCNFHYLGNYCSPNLSIHQNSTQEPTWNFLVILVYWWKIVACWIVEIIGKICAT